MANKKAAPVVTGQCGQVLSLIRELQPVLSFTLTADHAIPETAARVHDLRCMGFNILTTIHPAVEFRGVIRRNVASYSLGTPEWPQPGFFRSTAGAVSAVETSTHKNTQFIEDAAQCMKRSADLIAGAMASIPDEEKHTNERAILRNLRRFLEFSRWRNSAASGRAGV